MSDPIALIAALEEPNVRPFLWMIRKGEGTQSEDGYRVMFGGERFDSFADHPRKAIKRGSLTSTAAGAYQFLARTWDGLVRQYGFADFSPTNQDLGCVALIKGRGALDDVIAGRFEQAVAKCNKEWASLPGSPYGQPVVTLALAKSEYEAAGGLYAADPLVHLGPEPIAALSDSSSLSFTGNDPTTPQPDAHMFPLIPLALEALAAIVPKLGEVFPGGQVAQRNVKAASIVLEAAKSAVNAVNEQDLIEKINNDPRAAEAVKEAVAGVWYQVVEAGGGGIAGARESNAKASGPDGHFWLNPAFWISFILLAMPFMLLVDVFYVHPDSYDGNLRTQIVTGILVIVGMVGAYWLGTSASSAKKDALIAGK